MDLWAALSAFVEDRTLLSKSSEEAASLEDTGTVPSGPPAFLTPADVLAAFPFPVLFGALRDATVAGDLVKVRLVQVALSKLFPLVPVDTLIRDPGFFTYINQGLLHPDDAVRDLSSVVLARCLTWRQPGETLPPLDDSSAVKLVKQHVHKLIVDAEGLVTTLVNQIADTKISVAQRCSDVIVLLISFAGDSEGSEPLCALVSAGALALFGAVDSGAAEGEDMSILTARLLHLLSQLAGASNTACRAVIRAGCLQRLYDAVAGDDILLLVNTLQFLPAIARSPQGAGFVIESGLLNRLLELGGLSGSEGADPFVGPAAVEAVGGLYTRCFPLDGPALHSTVVPNLLSAATPVLQDEEAVELSIAYLSALSAVVGVDEAAFQLVLSPASRGLAAAWLSSCVSSSHSVRSAALHSLATLLEASGPSREPLCVLLVRLCEEVCGGPLTPSLLDILAQPVDQDSRYGAMHVCRGLSGLPSGWGIKVMFSTPGFLEFFAAPGGEATKEGRLWKVSLTEAVRANIAVLPSVLSSDLAASLSMFLTRSTAAASAPPVVGMMSA